MTESNDLAFAALGLGIFLLVIYVLALWKKGTKEHSLAVPKGSVRAMLAIMIVAGYLIIIAFGKDALSTDSGDTSLYTNVVSGLTGVVGAVVGFYFGGKTGSETPGGSTG